MKEFSVKGWKIKEAKVNGWYCASSVATCWNEKETKWGDVYPPEPDGYNIEAEVENSEGSICFIIKLSIFKDGYIRNIEVKSSYGCMFKSSDVKEAINRVIGYALRRRNKDTFNKSFS